VLERDELLVQVAKMYYEQNLTQADIARRISTSRSTVSRLLDDAREAGLVEIIIHDPWRRSAELEAQLCERWPLAEAFVLERRGRASEEVIRGIGKLAALYVDGAVAEGMIFGLSWGRTVASAVRALRPTRQVHITVVQIIGAAGTEDPLIDGPDLVRLFASAYGGEYRYLHAPLLIEDTVARDALLQEPRIQDTLALARRADIALVGIGSLAPEESSPIWAGYLNQRAKALLRSQGAVGHMCGQHFDANGHVLDIDLNRRVIGLDLQDLRQVRQVIGVAGGRGKAQAILGALRGGYLNVLVTDDTAAREVLTLDAAQAGQRRSEGVHSAA